MPCFIALLPIGPKPTPTAFAATKAYVSEGSLILEFGSPDGSTRRFVLDSGSDVTYLKATSFPNLIQGEKLPLSVRGRVVATLTPYLEAIHPLSEEGIDGLLGDDFLRQVVLAVDVSAGVAKVWPKATPLPAVLKEWGRGHPDDASLVPIPLGLDASGGPTLRAVFDETPLTAFLDTGTGLSTLRAGLLGKIRNVRLGTKTVDAWEGQEKATMLLIPALKAGRESIPYPIVMASPDLGGSDAILGLDVLAAGSWVMDLSGRRFYFRKDPESKGKLTSVAGFSLFPLHGGTGVRIGAGHPVPPGVYPVRLIDGMTGPALARAFRDDRPGDDVLARLNARGKFLREVLDRGLRVSVAYRGRTVELTLWSPPKDLPEKTTKPTGDLPPPPGPAAPGYHWRYVPGTGWIQEKNAG